MNLLCYLSKEPAKRNGFPWFVMVHDIATIATAVHPQDPFHFIRQWLHLQHSQAPQNLYQLVAITLGLFEITQLVHLWGCMQVKDGAWSVEW